MEDMMHMLGATSLSIQHIPVTRYHFIGNCQCCCPSHDAIACVLRASFRPLQALWDSLEAAEARSTIMGHDLLPMAE